MKSRIPLVSLFPFPQHFDTPHNHICIARHTAGVTLFHFLFPGAMPNY